MPVFTFFIKPTSISTSILEYKSNPADPLEALVGIIASLFINTISIIIFYLLFFVNFFN